MAGLEIMVRTLCVCSFLTISVVFGVDQILEDLVHGNQKFTVDIYEELAKTYKGNFAFSPFSAFILLSLLKGCSSNNTNEEFQRVLQLPDTRVKTQQAVLKLYSCSKLENLIANKIYISDIFEFNEEFQNIAREIYRTGFEKVNFTDNIKAAELINSWVREHTQYKVRNLIDPIDIDGHTKMVLASALGLSDNWKTKFLPIKTKKQLFSTPSGSKFEMEMMRAVQKVKFFHCPVVNAKYLILEFQNPNYHMEFVLPDDPSNNLAVLERRLERILKHSEFREERVNIWLPKFSQTTEIDFIPILQKLGIKRIFEPEQADLTGISDDPELHVDFVVQKTSVHVNENGVHSNGSASVSVSSVLSALPQRTTLSFKADRPFFYCIKEKSGIVLLTGRFISPKPVDLFHDLSTK